MHTCIRVLYIYLTVCVYISPHSIKAIQIVGSIHRDRREGKQAGRQAGRQIDRQVDMGWLR